MLGLNSESYHHLTFIVRIIVIVCTHAYAKVSMHYINIFITYTLYTNFNRNGIYAYKYMNINIYIKYAQKGKLLKGGF